MANQQKNPGSLGKKLIQGLEDILADSQGKDAGVTRYTIPKGATAEEIGCVRRTAGKATARKLKLIAPPEIDAKKVKAIRDSFQLSQQMFADFIGVGVALVRAWEGGTRSPKGADRRLFADIHDRPEYWAAQVASALVSL